jgi:hypothetical protein
MQDANYAAFMSRWLAQMASTAGTSKIPAGPIQVLGAKAGRGMPKPGPAGPKVPAYGKAAQVSKR